MREDLESFVKPGTEAADLAQAIDFDGLPRHVAIIMDGNGRWARKRRLPRVSGHRAGIASVRDIVETSARLGLQVLTLYAFSLENWKRPRAEVETLMRLLREYLRKELEPLLRNDIRFQVIGRMDALTPRVQRELEKGMEATAGCGGLTFNIALSYGGRAEIVDACNRLIDEARAGKGPGEVDEDTFARYLYTAGQPDPDLLIRTSGEMRLSNFLLWQVAYAELWVTDTLWPDFRHEDLFRAILDYQKRDRRYGGIADPPEPGAASPSRALSV
jgi:undecaprenyl diphosphate synthase